MHPMAAASALSDSDLVRSGLARMEALIHGARLGRIESVQGTCVVHGSFAGYRIGREVSRCPLCAQERAAREAQERIATSVQSRRSDVAAQRLLEHIPERYVSASLDAYKVYAGRKQEQVLQVIRHLSSRVEEWILAGTNLCLLGSRGTGKTHLSVCLMRSAIDAGHTANLVTASQIFSLTKGYKEEEALAKLASFDLLVIDEIGLQKGSSDEEIRLGTLANLRYNARRPTIWVSNLDRSEFLLLVGARVHDRIAEDSGLLLECTWESYRRQAEKPEVARSLQDKLAKLLNTA